MSNTRVPKQIIYTLLILAVLAMIPPVLIAKMRATTSPLTRIHLQQDMAKQHRFSTQQPNPMFNDGRASRPPVPGTVARGELRDDDHLNLGVVSDDWANMFPHAITVNRELLERGRERYDIFCAVCHGVSGYGDGPVHHRAEQAQAAGRFGTVWVPPKSLHEPDVRERPLGHLYNTITNGLGNMAGYKSQIPVEDRWAIVAYVKALQRSQDAQQDQTASASASHVTPPDIEMKEDES